MSAHFSTLHPSVFDAPSVMRILRLGDDRFRFATAMYKAHGRRPDQFTNAAMVSLGVNVVLRGSGTYTDAAGNHHTLRPGSVFHRLPGQTHSTFFDPESDYAEFFLTIDADTAASLLALGLVAPTTPVVQTTPHPAILDQFENLRVRLRAPETEVPGPRALLDILQFLSGLYDRAAHRAGEREEGWAGKIALACRLLEEAHGQDMPGLEEIAARLGVPYPTFRRRFRAVLGVSPGEYRIGRRLERACSLLMVYPVGEVAERLGYCDPFTFSAQFKRFMGVSPRAFQERTRR